MPDAAAGELSALEARLGHRFADPTLLSLALTHPSYANERGVPGRDNERLEFLGDAVLALAMRELLMEARPQDDEGRLSKACARLVSRRALVERARSLGLDQWVRLGRGEERSAGSGKATILANAFEAVLGALYLDGGFAPARALLAREYAGELAEEGPGRGDSKTALQELLQARRRAAPQYATTASHGPAHSPRFHVEVRVEGELLGSGVGGSKQEAEQEAARQALERLT